MKTIFRLFLLTLTVLALHILLTSKVQAVTFTYPKYDVDIQIDKDSTFIVTEKADYILNGEAHGLRRDLTLYDSTRANYCLQDADLTCGGFDRVKVLNVTDNNGRELTSDEFKFYNVDTDSGTAARFEWTIWPDGEEVTDYKVGWTIKYGVYGGIQKIGDNPYFYWNMLPEDRGGLVTASTLKIHFPDGMTPNPSNFSTYFDDKYDFEQDGNTFIIALKNLSYFGNFTAAYKFNIGEVILPGSISYNINSPLYGTTVYLDNEEISSDAAGQIKGVQAGSHLLEIKHFGYETYSNRITITQGENAKVDVTLEPQIWMKVLIFLNYLFIILGCAFVPLSLVFGYLYYRKKGRDMNMPKTIIPLYSPPKDTPPYLLGTIKDETVDKQDIVGSIIDLAYRGFLKIKEVTKNDNYELKRTDKDTSSLNDTEMDILDAVFNGADVKETKDMRYYFPSKYMNLQDKIYKEVVKKGFFDRSPRTTIGMYAGLGFLLIIIGGASFIFLSPILTNILGIISVFTIGAAIGTLGFFFLIFSKFMPAKTEKGSKVFADILGFKMYLNTAERYRLQNLGPEEFEKYLSYAIVFGIEKEWAKKFEGIYKGQPEWFEGSGNIYDAYIISSFARSFSNASVSSMTPISSSSSSGSGWSGGGGSFGGFSGGGGGGGSSGGW